MGPRRVERQAHYFANAPAVDLRELSSQGGHNAGYSRDWAEMWPEESQKVAIGFDAGARGKSKGAQCQRGEIGLGKSFGT
jgi:hypothetical protein